MSAKKWCIGFIMTTTLILMPVGLLNLIVDPFFHFHKPNSHLQYTLLMGNGRYFTDGIVRNFEYDALITGTCMVSGFKASEFRETFGLDEIKIPLPDGRFKEIDQYVRTAAECNKDLKLVLRGLDYKIINADKDTQTDDVFPDYLYDRNPFNDTRYLLNGDLLWGDTFYHTILYTLKGGTTTSFDEYANHVTGSDFGRDIVINAYRRPEKVNSDSQIHLTVSEKERLIQNVSQNILDTADTYPDIDFYLFYTPYNIYFWDSLNQKNEVEKQLEIDRLTSELLMSRQNIHLFSFYDDFDLICNADHYSDEIHYDYTVNSYILHQMKEGEHQLTPDNYDQYYKKISDFYRQFDYSSLY